MNHLSTTNGFSSDAPCLGALGAPAWSFRPFGQNRADLDLDFATEDRPRLVTEILYACKSDSARLPPDINQIWKLSVSGRIKYLLCLASASGGFTSPISLICPQNKCGQRLEVDLPIIAILDLQQRAEKQEYLYCQSATGHLQLRRPTGGDQSHWRRRCFANEADTRAALCSSLLVNTEGAESTNASLAEHAPGWADSLDSQLEEFDPLVAFSIGIRCPHCEMEVDFPMDLEALALNALEKIQRRLFQDIHRLAAVYHWSETEIFGLSPRRRGRYLKFIEEAAL